MELGFQPCFYAAPGWQHAINLDRILSPLVRVGGGLRMTGKRQGFRQVLSEPGIHGKPGKFQQSRNFRPGIPDQVLVTHGRPALARPRQAPPPGRSASILSTSLWLSPPIVWMPAACASVSNSSVLPARGALKMTIGRSMIGNLSGAGGAAHVFVWVARPGLSGQHLDFSPQPFDVEPDRKPVEMPCELHGI